MSHTKGKWEIVEEIEDNGISAYQIWSDSDGYIAESPAKNTAEYIVKAVNNHEKLLKIIKFHMCTGAEGALQYQHLLKEIE